MRILIVKEKHGDYYYDVSSDELLHKTCVKILKDRLEAGWYGADVGELENKTGFSSREEIDALPDGSIKQRAIDEFKMYENRKRCYDDDKNFREKAKKIIATDFKDIPQDHERESVNESRRRFSYSWLTMRDGCEYEGIMLEKVSNIEDEE